MRDADLKPIIAHTSSAPGPSWRELLIPTEPGGCLTIYYSDVLSSLAVREVTRPGDNKSDPNLETLTYGMFSTCGRQLRDSVVNHGDRYLFFATKRGNQRVLTGYYDLQWFAESNSAADRDFCLAARTARFIAKPIPLTEVDKKCGTDTANWFRTFRRLEHKACFAIKALIDKQTDATKEFVNEIHRLENFNRFHGGYRYVGWKQLDEFSWELAGKYLRKPAAAAKKAKTVNSSPRDLWRCSACKSVSANKSLLRCCPDCGAIATLVPVREVEQ
jgi:hypothetical protein